MKVNDMKLQINGIDLISFKELDIILKIEDDLKSKGVDPHEKEVDIYMNIEGTQVNVYYITRNDEAITGVIRLN